MILFVSIGAMRRVEMHVRHWTNEWICACVVPWIVNSCSLGYHSSHPSRCRNLSSEIDFVLNSMLSVQCRTRRRLVANGADIGGQRKVLAHGVLDSDAFSPVGSYKYLGRMYRFHLQSTKTTAFVTMQKTIDQIFTAVEILKSGTERSRLY